MEQRDFLGAIGITALHPWQQRLLDSDRCTDRLIRIPTGMGKTLGVLTTWLWHAVIRRDPAWPRRLVWCLPMRVLVEQTHAEVQRVIAQLAQAPGGAPAGQVGVHLLMGGHRIDDWHQYPERHAVLVGTQDMLLSRALNRGYAAARARWPMEFGLLHQDALWVMDEVQLMDVGLMTSAQLQAFRNQWAADGQALRPCHTWWMSATLQPAWLQSPDTGKLLDAVGSPLESLPEERSGALWRVRKAVRIEAVAEDKDGKRAAEIIAAAHAERGGLTLSVHNTVAAAVCVFERLKKQFKKGGPELRLVHSRFRAFERERWRDAFLNKGANLPAEGRIVVATQVVEAGVDISADTLITDIAPWPSLVQRMGRCARFGDTDGVCIFLHHGWGEGDDKKTAPYALDEVVAAQDAVHRLAQEQQDASIAAIERFEASLSPEERAVLYPYDPPAVLLESEVRDLFDTSPDLTGADIDVSSYIRSGDDHDCLLFWRHLEPEQLPDPAWQPARSELCPAPFLDVRSWLFDKTRIKTNKKGRPVAFVWDYVDGAWNPNPEPRHVLPGSVILVAADTGGYDPQVGWRPKAAGDPALDISGRLAAAPAAHQLADSREVSDALSETQWQTIADHCRAVARTAAAIANSVGAADYAPAIETAALAHDLGKALPFFQNGIDQDRAPAAMRGHLAKAPQDAWNKDRLYTADGETRAGLRHELASALALLEVVRAAHSSAHPALAGDFADVLPVDRSAQEFPVPDWLAPVLDDPLTFDLALYLCAAHHGKVRCALQSSPQDQRYAQQHGDDLPIRGICDGDVLPAVPNGDGTYFPQVTVHTDVARMGLSPRYGRSWTDRVQRLITALGPAGLAYLEALLRAADIRVSAGNQGGLS